MSEPFDIAKLLTLRKITRAISDYQQQKLKASLATLWPLLDPRVVFGEFIGVRGKKPGKGEITAFDQLKEAYLKLATTGPFRIPKELNPPVEIHAVPLEVSAVEYTFTPEGGDEEIVVTSPLKWVVTPQGFGLAKLNELAAAQKANVENAELQQCILHHLAVHVVMAQRPNLTDLFQSIRFPVISDPSEAHGGMPLTLITCPVSTMRPPDDVIIQSTEISGTPAFEEVVDPQQIVDLSDPYKDELLEVARQHGKDLIP